MCRFLDSQQQLSEEKQRYTLSKKRILEIFYKSIQNFLKKLKTWLHTEAVAEQKLYVYIYIYIYRMHQRFQEQLYQREDQVYL